MTDLERINELTDHISRLQVQEKAHAADLKRVKSAIAEAEYQLVMLMLDNHLTTIGSSLAVAELQEKIVPQVVDWSATYEHIKHTGDFDLLHRRVSLTAFNERFKVGVVVPGIEARTLTTVKVSPHG